MTQTLQFIRYSALVLAAGIGIMANAGKYGISDEEQVRKLDTVISLCNDIRGKKDANVKLSLEFDEWFAELVKTAKNMCDTGNRIPYLASTGECHNKVDKITFQMPTTIYEWNLVNYQLVLLFDAINSLVREDGVNHVSAKDRGLVLGALESRKKTEDLINSKTDLLAGATMELLKPSDDDGFEYCPIATPFMIGAQWINHAFARGIAPLGVSFKPLYYDGSVNGPLRFFIHDGFHYRSWLTDVLHIPPSDQYTKPTVFALLFEDKEFKGEKTGDMFSKRLLTEQQRNYLADERKLSTDFVNFVDNFKGQYKNPKKYYNPDETTFQCSADALSLALFRVSHEEAHRLSDLSRLCDAGEFYRSTFNGAGVLLSRSHSNALLPKELQHGLEKFSTKFDKFMERVAKSTDYIMPEIQEFLDKNDTIHQITSRDVAAYAINADGCLCEAWKQFNSQNKQ